MTSICDSFRKYIYELIYKINLEGKHQEFFSEIENNSLETNNQSLKWVLKKEIIEIKENIYNFEDNFSELVGIYLDSQDSQDTIEYQLSARNSIMSTKNLLIPNKIVNPLTPYFINRDIINSLQFYFPKEKPNKLTIIQLVYNLNYKNRIVQSLRLNRWNFIPLIFTNTKKFYPDAIDHNLMEWYIKVFDHFTIRYNTRNNIIQFAKEGEENLKKGFGTNVFWRLKKVISRIEFCYIYHKISRIIEESNLPHLPKEIIEMIVSYSLPIRETIY